MRKDLLSGGYPLESVSIISFPHDTGRSIPMIVDGKGQWGDVKRIRCKGEGTYPESCRSKDDLPGKSLFETTFPIDSLFSLASL